jgi:hypothetical protein
MNHYDLAAYVRHARQHGVEQVFETAAGDLSITELGCLAAHLRRLDPKWRLPHHLAHALAVALVREGVNPSAACNQAGLSRRTLRRLLRENAMPSIQERHVQ